MVCMSCLWCRYTCMSWLWWHMCVMAVMVAWQIAKARYPLVGSSILAASLYNFYKSLAAMLCMSWLWWHMPMCVCRGCDGLMPDCQKYIQRYGARFSESRSKNLHTTIATPLATPLATSRMHAPVNGTWTWHTSRNFFAYDYGCVWRMCPRVPRVPLKIVFFLFFLLKKLSENRKRTEDMDTFFTTILLLFSYIIR